MLSLRLRVKYVYEAPSRVRVCVRGLFMRAALSAASEGADVAWLVRVARYAEIAKRIVSEHGPSHTRRRFNRGIVSKSGDFHGTGLTSL